MQTVWLIHARNSQPCNKPGDFQGPSSWWPGRPEVADERPADTKTSGRQGQCVVVVDSGWPFAAAVLADSVVASPFRGGVSSLLDRKSF